MGSPAGGGGYGAPQGGGYGGGWGGYGKPAPKVGYGGQMGQGGANMPMVETGLWRGPMEGRGNMDQRMAYGGWGGGHMGMPMGGPQKTELQRPLDGLGGFDPRTGTIGGGIQQPLGSTPPGMGGGMGGPMPTAAPAVQPPAVDHAANFQSLYAQNPQMANEYRTRSGDTMSWWQNGGRDQALQGQFGGNQNAMNNWVNSTSGQGGAQNGAITGQQTAQLNSMAGVRPPDWALNAYRQGRGGGQAVNPMYEQFL